MAKNVFLLSVGVVLLLFNDPSLAGEYCQDQDCDNSASGMQESKSRIISDLSADFETLPQNVWIDESQTGVRWKIENSNSPWELNNPAPKPLEGRNYMRVDRGATLSFGVAILRSQIIRISVSNYVDISMSFDFWIRSKWPQFTNLELYFNENGNEKLLANLSEYSDITNTNWITYWVWFPSLRNGSEFSLAFYAYCGRDVEDAVAIDNIRWMDRESLSTTITYPTVAESTTQTTSTTTEKTTEAPTDAPTDAPTEALTDALTTEEEITTSTVQTTTEQTTTWTPITDCYSFIVATPTDTNLTSPGYPDFYEANQTCYYTITAPSPLGIIRLNFYDIDMEPNDFVKVYDGKTISSPNIVSLTGNSSSSVVPDQNNPPIYEASCSSGTCYIQHFSDPFPQGNLRGWRATYSVCGGSYNATGTETRITSPNYPKFYHTRQFCNYTITSFSPNGKIRLEIVDFEMEAQHDWLWVYDGSTIGSPLLLQATGYPGYGDPSFNQLPNPLPYSVNSSGSVIWLEHFSDRSIHGSLRGWIVNFVETVD